MIIQEKKRDIREEFDELITSIHLRSTKAWLAEQLGITPGHLTNILKCREILSEKNRKKLNELLGTNI